MRNDPRYGGRVWVRQVHLVWVNPSTVIDLLYCFSVPVE